MVASELANDIERRMHKGPFRAVLVFMHVTESGARGYSQTLFTSVPACGYGPNANEE
jgi:hypothetical protein